MLPGRVRALLNGRRVDPGRARHYLPRARGGQPAVLDGLLGPDFPERRVRPPLRTAGQSP